MTAFRMIIFLFLSLFSNLETMASISLFHGHDLTVEYSHTEEIELIEMAQGRTLGQIKSLFFEFSLEEQIVHIFRCIDINNDQLFKSVQNPLLNFYRS